MLKIDRSFISGLPLHLASVALTTSIIGLAAAFGLVTVAERSRGPVSSSTSCAS